SRTRCSRRRGCGTTASSIPSRRATCSASRWASRSASPFHRRRTACSACEVISMAFELSPEEQLIIQTVREIAGGPGGQPHWYERALAHEFPEKLWQALADAGFLGTLVPQAYGGAGLGLVEMALLMETMAAEGMALLLMIVSTVMATVALAKHGTE